jgi:pyridoxamine 5'-phosphate oxidase family protein
MRAFAILLALGLTALVVYCVALVVTSIRNGPSARLREKGAWKVQHYSRNGMTVVAVGLTTPRGDVIEEHVVARIPDESDDWQARFLGAKQEAEERAFHLNQPT